MFDSFTSPVHSCFVQEKVEWEAESYLRLRMRETSSGKMRETSSGKMQEICVIPKNVININSNLVSHCL